MPLNKVTADSIADGTVIAADIANGAVTGPKLGLTAINANNIVSGAVTGDKIATGQITGNLLTANCVSGNNIVSSPTITGNVTINGSLGIGGATPASSGFGITFPATQSASTDANTLDDYEEGTWSPALSPATGSITTNTGSSSGRYTKIGNRVFISGYLIVSSVSTPSGRLTLTGLPFSMATGDPFSRMFGRITYATTQNAYTGTQVCGGNGATGIFIDRDAGTGADPATDLASSIKANTEYYISCHYQTA